MAQKKVPLNSEKESHPIAVIVAARALIDWFIKKYEPHIDESKIITQAGDEANKQGSN